MPGPATTLAKLTPPRLYAITRRERLFTLLNKHHRHHKLIWVAGPPGAGKTSLIATYLAEQRQRTLWYHIDPGDADLATFFHYLAKAAQTAAGRKRVTLPLLTPEFLGDVQAFTRKFFRELWSKVPSPAVLVLDNYQNIPASATLHQILPVALSEFPVDTTLMAISRETPPQQFAREQTHNLVGHITWEDLRLTFEETMSLAGSTSGMTQDLLRTLHEKANGWMAGTVLMLERYKTQRTFPVANPPEKRTDVFHYFADQVFEMMTSRERDVLMRTALLPWVTAPMSEEVSDDSAAAEVFRDLYRRGLFVDRRTDEQERYQYHDLFREFLLERGRIHFDEETLHRFKRTAAQVAEKYRQHDTAVALYAETHSWDELTELIRANAVQLLAQGRHQTIQSYMGLLPHAEREKRPWLLYWSGTSRMLFDPVAARKDLESAYQQFELSQQDIAGLLLTCSGIIESYICGVDDMAPTIAWGNRLQQLLHQSHGFPSPQIEARVLTSLQGLLYASPHHPFLAELEVSLDRLLYSLDDPASRCGVVATFVNLPLWRGDFRRARQMLDQLLPYMDSALVPPGTRLCWNVMEANHAWNVRHHDQAKEKLARAQIIAEEYGILVWQPMIIGISAYNALAAGDDQEGERLAELIASKIQPHHRLGQGQCSFYRAGVALLRNDLSSALHHATSALNTTASLCIPFMTANCRVGLAKVLVEMGEFAKAREQLEEALEYARIMRSSLLEVHSLLSLAQLFFREGHIDHGQASLQEGLRIASRNDYLVLENWWRPKVMADLMAHALEAGIEVEYVRSVIQRRNLRAPSAALTRWPYPITITTLGRFELVMADVPITMLGKTQRKPLELLKYLCTVGEQGLHQDLIEEALWPEADGEAAEQAFRTTLHRLRKLLRHEDAVQLADRHISLDPSLVALDHVAFDRMAQNADRTDTVALDRVLALYRGHFLQGETAPWVFLVRERLRARFLEFTDRLGTLLEERGQPDEAVQRYLRALEVEPTAEVMCRRVMMTYVRLGRSTEAIGIYHRFSHALRTKLGVAPTPETISLYHTIATA
ncbi:BTAD domain-containing putative transcriptional regulator [Nitrospira sp. BLG_1]|uniref:BTAD domain-containing putative transcriptional regulator n=1 Tax=Nitrospira sp. BLG_1 TaxID=3395883 RepID=UPI0039BCF359